MSTLPFPPSDGMLCASCRAVLPCLLYLQTSHSWQLPSWISFRVVAASILALLLLPVLLRSRAYSSSRRNTALAPTQLQPHVQGTMIKAAVSPSSASKEDAKQKKVAAAMAADVFADSATNGEDTAMEGVQVASVTSHSLNGLQLQQHHDQQQQPNQPGPLSNGALSPAFSAADLLVANGSPSSLVDPGLLSPGGLSPVPASGGSAGVSEAGSGVGQPISRSYLDEDGAVVIGRLRVGPGILGYGSGGENGTNTAATLCGSLAASSARVWQRKAAVKKGLGQLGWFAR